MSKFNFALAYISATLFQAEKRSEEKGATAVEYGMLVALIAAVIVAVVATLGTKIGTAFSTINNQLP